MKTKPTRPVLEEFEPRILYSADFAPAALAGFSLPGASEQRLLQAQEAPAATQAAAEIAFVDLSLPDAQSLIDDLQAQRDAGRPIEVVRIDAAEDGITRISETLAGRTDVSAVHVLSHGDDGVLQLGSARLDSATLLARAGELAQWSAALSADADLLLYGCDVAQSAAGEQFVNNLGALTGADVASSTDLTGAAAQGGNWTLEYSTGRIEAALAIDAAGQQAWAGTLAVAFASESSGGTTSATTSYDFSHNVNSGSDRLLLVELVIANGVDASSVSFNGNALTLLARQNSPSGHVGVEVWYLVAPPVTSGTVNVTLASASTLAVGATSYSGVNQSTPLGTPVAVAGSIPTPAAVVAADTGDLVVDIVGARSVSSNLIGLGQTQNFVQSQGTGANDLFAVSSREAGAASVTMGHVFTSIDGNWASIAVEINQVGAVNTVPVNSLPASAAVVQDSTLAFTAANAISISDAEAGSAPVRVDLSVTNGSLSLQPTIGPEFQVNTTTASNQQAPRIAVAADGHYVVVWQSNNQDGSKFGVYARVFNADGSARTGEIAVNTTTNDQQSNPSVAIDGSGRFVIAWQSYDTTKLTYDIYARSYAADGSALSAQKRITTDADDQTLAAVSMDAAGNVVIAYQSKGQDSGVTQGIYARTANATLSTINAEIRINTTIAGDQAAPAIAAGGSGFVVVWQSSGQDGSGNGIYGQRYTTAGAKVGGEFLINSITGGDQTAPAVAMAADGRFTVAWESMGQDNADGKTGIYARRFAADGSALGTDTLVNTTTLGDQTAPSVAVAANGRFVVGWTSKGQDHGDGKEGVYAQGFAADGSRLGTEFRLNTQTTDVQSMPSIGMRTDGGLLAVWQSNNQDGNGYGVLGQRFMAPGAITFLSGDGVADASISITGAQADINVALQTLRYTPDAGYWGPASLTLVTNDLGAGSGPALATTSVLPIQVLKIDVGPTNTVPAAQAVAEDAPIVFSSANGNAISVADVDADPLPVQVSLSVAQGTLRLASTAGLTVVGGADGTGSIVVQGRLADLNSALDGLTYTPTLNRVGADTLTLATNDLGHSDIGGPYTATSTVGIAISAVNDAAVIQLPGALATPEGTTLVLSSANGNLLRIVDPDAGSSNIEVTLVSTGGELKLARTNNLSFVVGDGGGGEQRITFRGTLTNVNLALDGLRFDPLAGYAGPAWLEVATNDLGNSGAGGALADRAVLEIAVQPDANNAKPVIALPGNQTTNEETALTLSLAGGNGITVLDDAGGLPLTVTLSVTGGTLTLGTTTGGEFQVASAVSSDQQAAVVAMTPSGTSIVVWQSNNQDGSGQGIYAQRYSEDGFAVGPEQRVNTTTAGSQTAPAIWAADDGSFVVVWTSDGMDGGGGGGTGIFGQRFDANGQPLGGEFRVNTMLAGDQAAPALAGDAAGNFVVVWQSKDQDGAGWGVYGQRFTAGGTPLGAELRINSTTGKDQTAPVVAMGDGGSFVVAWQSVRQDGDDWGIYAQRFDAAGNAAGAEFRVTTVTFKDQAQPAIAADAAGNFVVVWQSEDVDYNDGKFGIYAQRFAANGSALGAQFLVNTTVPNDQTAPAVTMDASGAFAITWQSKDQDGADDKEGVYAQRYDAAGVRLGGEFRVNSTTADAQTLPSLAMSDQGQLFAVWTSDKQDSSGLGVFGQRFIDARSLAFSVGDGIDDATMTFTGSLAQINDVLDGLVFSPAPDFDGKALLDITVNDLGNSGSGGVKIASDTLQITVLPANDAPTVTLPAPTTFVEDAAIEFSAALGRAITIGDVDAGNKKLLVTLAAPVGTLTLGALNGLQFSVGDGTADETMTFTGTLTDVNAALDGLRFVLPAHYTGAASLDVSVNDQGNTGTGGALGTAASVSLTVLPGAVNDAPQILVPGPQRTAVDTPLMLADGSTGTFTVTDDAGSTPVRVTVTVTNGTATLSSTINAEATINRTTTAGSQEEPRIAVLPNGDHIVVWTSDFAASGSTGVVGQRFDAAGARVGPEFLVNTTAAEDQWAPALAANDSGAFVVAWVSDNQDGSGRGIYLQRFDAQGQRLGGETRVNTSIAGDQMAPAVAIDASGAVVVAWTSADGDGLGVFAQRFDANGEPAGSQFQVNLGSADDQKAPSVAMDAAGNFVIVWQGQDADKEGVLARRFDSAGNPLGGEFVVNSATAGSQLSPVVAMNASGTWVVGWQNGSGGSAGEIVGQRYDASGNAVGAQFQVNTTTVEAQTAPSVAINANGDFAFAWQSRDGNGQGIFGQSFAADGTPVGTEQRVNTTTSGDQVAPSVGIAADGTYRVVWTGAAQDGSSTGIAGQRMLRGDELVFLVGDGINDASFTFDATLADLNAALDGLHFTPSTGFIGVAQVQVSVDDLGASGSGGARIGTGSVSIVVGNAPLIDLDANDSAGIAGSDYRSNFRTGLGPVSLADTDAAISDPNSGNLQRLTVRIQNPADGAAELLAANTGGTAIIASYDSATATLTLSGSSSIANYQKVLRTVTYNNTAATPTLATRSVTFVAFDGSGDSNIATANVTFNGGVDTPPVAGDDVFVAIEEQALSAGPGSLLVNDYDPDYDAISAVLVSGPSFGTLASFNADGSFSYVPAAGFNGVDSFTYRATSGGLDSGVATVTIVVSAVNDAPQGADATRTVDEDQAYTFALADFGFSDPDDGVADGLLGVRIATLPAPGVLAVGGAAVSAGDVVAASDITAGRLVFTPAPDANGLGYAQIGFQVIDDGGTTNGGADTDPVVRQLTIDVNPVGDAPAVGMPIADLTATEDAPFVFAVPAGSLVDADAGDTLSYSATLADGSALPSWLSFDAATQTFSGTPGNTDVGSISVRVTATDGSGATGFDDFVLTVANANDAPTVATPLADQTAVQDVAFSFTLPAGSFADIDAGDSLTYSATLTDGSALPAWLSFDAATQTFSGTPGNADVGSLSVRVTATDSFNASVFDDFALTVANTNDAPTVAIPLADQAATQDVAFSFTLPSGSFADIDTGDTLSYSATLFDGSALPSWLSFDAATQTFSGTPGNADVGSISVRVTATDGSGATGFDDFVLTVANTNDAPAVAIPLADQAAMQDVAFSFTLPAGSFADIDTGDTLSYSATLFDGSALPTWLSFDAATQTFNGTPGNADVGLLSVRVTATDSSNASVFDDFVLTVADVNDAPAVVIPLADHAAMQDVAFSFTVPAGSFADIDAGDALSYSATRVDGSALPAWLSFDAATQTFSGTPGNADVGSLSVRVTATDSSNASVFDDFVLTVADVNDAPAVAIPLADQAAMQDVAFSFTVPAGSFADIDAGDALSYSATRVDGSALPAWLSFDAATRTFSGTPASADIGAIGVRVTATDGSGATGSEDFVLTVVKFNRAPVVALPIADQSASQGAALAFTLPAGTFADSDVGDSLSYGATLASGAALPAWLSFDAATQTFSGTPGNADVGSLSVRVTATDGSGSSAFDDFMLTVANTNDAPMLASPLADQAATQDLAFSFTLPAGSFADIDAGDTLSYSATLADGSALPTWLSFDAATQTFSGTPGNADVGLLSVRVTAIDSSNASAFDDFRLMVTNVNDSPVITSNGGGASASVNLAEGTTAVTSVTATDADALDVLRFAITGGADAARFAIDPVSGTLSFVAAPNHEAPVDANADNRYEVTVTVSDGALIAQQALFVDVGNVDEAPTIVTNVLLLSKDGATIVLLGTDPDTDSSALNYQASSQVGGRFELVAAPGIAVTDFSQAQVDAGAVRFVADGSGAGPTYALRLSDGVSTVVSSAPNVVVQGPAAALAETPAAPTPDPTPDPTPAAATAAPTAAPTAPQAAAPPVVLPAAPDPLSQPLLPDFRDDPFETFEPTRASSNSVVAGVAASTATRDSTVTAVATLAQFALLSETSEDATNSGAPTIDLASALRDRLLAEQLDQQRDSAESSQRSAKDVQAATAMLTTGLSVGYLLWLARGGVLVASLMSALPAWAMVDPLPVLAQMKRRDGAPDDGGADDDADDPLEKLFSKARQVVARGVNAPPTPPATPLAPDRAAAETNSLEQPA